MKKQLYLFLFSLPLLACQPKQGVEPKTGDLIFQTSLSSQSAAIQKATRSKYSHMGIIFYRNDSPYVLEASQTVQFTPLQKWIQRGEGSHYVIKRLRDADRRLTPETVAKLSAATRRFLGRPYDLYFDWSDERIYCSELAWKLYHEALAVDLGKLQRLGEFDLSDPVIQKKMKERFGDKIPMEEKVISPAAMFESSELVTVDKE